MTHISDALISLDKQTLFNHVVQRLFAQGSKCGEFDAEGDFCCSYKDDQGRRCALGHCLTPSFLLNLDDHLLSSGIETLLLEEVLKVDAVHQRDGSLIDFLSELQSAHDASENRETVVQLLRRVAVDHGLEDAALIGAAEWAAENNGAW